MHVHTSHWWSLCSTRTHSAHGNCWQRNVPLPAMQVVYSYSVQLLWLSIIMQESTWSLTGQMDTLLLKLKVHSLYALRWRDHKSWANSKPHWVSLEFQLLVYNNYKQLVISYSLCMHDSSLNCDVAIASFHYHFPSYGTIRGPAWGQIAGIQFLMKHTIPRSC